MQIKMIANCKGSANVSGNVCKEYKKGDILDCKEEWQVNLANTFVTSGLAMEIKVTEPTETKAPKKVAKKKTTKKK